MIIRNVEHGATFAFFKSPLDVIKKDIKPYKKAIDPTRRHMWRDYLSSSTKKRNISNLISRVSLLPFPSLEQGREE